MSQLRGGRLGSTRSAEALAKELDQMVAAIDQARAVGLSVAVPEPLYSACVAMIDRYEGHPGVDDTAIRETDPVPGAMAASLSRSGSGLSLADVPLRRLVLQVIDPETEFTVTDVVKRLAALGVAIPSNKVSNALGYWASRDRLLREGKGIYRYPAAASVNIQSEHLKPRQVDPAEDNVKSRREEGNTSYVEISKRQAM